MANLERDLSRNVCEPLGNPFEESRSVVSEDQDQRGHKYATGISIRESDAVI
jgi:hypothetical protein